MKTGWRHRIVVSTCIMAGMAFAQDSPDPWLQRSAKSKEFSVPAAGLPPGVTVELPKDWQVVPGYAEIVVSAAERTNRGSFGGVIVLERAQLRSSVSLTPALVPLEIATLTDRDPLGKGFAGAIKGSADRRVIFTQYIRSGSGADSEVTVYTMPVGAVVYRLVCIAPAAQALKYRPLFAHAAATLTVPPAIGR